MIAVQLDVIKNVVGAVTDGRPLGQLFFRIDHLIRPIAEQKFFLHIPGRSGYHHFGAQLFQQRGGFQGALKIIANGHNAHIKVADSQGFQKVPIGAVADLGVGHKGQHRLHPFLGVVHGHYLMAQIVQVYGNVLSKAAQAD